MTTLKVGIATLEQYKARTMAIVREEYFPAANEPKVWFQSPETLSQFFSNQNKPTSWQEFFELAESTDIPADFTTDRKDLSAEEKNLF